MSILKVKQTKGKMRQRDRYSKNQERLFLFVFVVKSIRKTERRKKGEYTLRRNPQYDEHPQSIPSCPI